jgi:hypothetical protein
MDSTNKWEHVIGRLQFIVAEMHYLLISLFLSPVSAFVIYDKTGLNLNNIIPGDIPTGR